MRVAYIGGAGRLGLPFALWSAERGHEVIISDVNEAALDAIRLGTLDRAEPMVNELARKHRERLTLLSDNAQAARQAELVCIVTATPSTPTGQFSSQYVQAAARSIAPALSDGYTVVNVVSTVMPGETRKVGREIAEISGLTVGADFGLTHSPEFIRQGSIVSDFRAPDFVVIGEHDQRAGDVAADYYNSLVDNNPPVHYMSLESAELTKTGLNAVVVAKMALANELAWLCHATPGADARDVLRAIGTDERVGRKYFSAGTWPGGPCFPRDTRALAAAGRHVGMQTPVIEEVSQAADRELQCLAALCKEVATDYPEIGILGLTYKPGVQLHEESQGGALFKALAHLGQCGVHDPALYDIDLKVFVQAHNLLILMTCWPEYQVLREMDLSGKCVVDMWGYLDGIDCDRYIRFGEGSNALV